MRFKLSLRVFLSVVDYIYFFSNSNTCEKPSSDRGVLPRDAMCKRGLLSPGVCLSVRLSRWWTVSRRLKIS